jgi:predicted DNA-binding transcriptional regulator AlpA
MTTTQLSAPEAASHDGADDDLLTSAQVRQHFGGISEMTLWRWTRDIGFPKPDKVIQRRKFWRRRTITNWSAPDRAEVA